MARAGALARNQTGNLIPMRTSQVEEAEVEQAIARVLQAEREAQDAVTRCASECAELVAAAHRHAGEVGARTERRIARWRENMGRMVERRVGELDSAAEAALCAEASDDGASGRLERAAAAVARELIGAAK